MNESLPGGGGDYRVPSALRKGPAKKYPSKAYPGTNPQGHFVARTLCPRNIRVLTIPDAAPAAAAGQALASQYPQLLYGTITAHGPHRRAAPHPPISASQPCTFFVSACGG